MRPFFDRMIAPPQAPAGFPPAAIVAARWRLGAIQLRPQAAGHGAQALVLPAQGEPWILKRCRVAGLEEAALEARLGALRAARAQGLEFIPELRPTDGERLVVEHEGEAFYLLARVDGRRPNFAREADVARVVATLGRLHREGAEIGRELGARLGAPAVLSLETEWREQLRPLRKIDKRIALWERPGLVGRAAIARHPAMREMVELASMFLERRGGLDRALDLTLVHGDSHENNYLLPAGEADAWLLDLESADARPGVMDLVVPLYLFMFAHRWPVDAMERLLGVYERERPLPEVERELLAALLMLPREWMRAFPSLLKRREATGLGMLRDLISAYRIERKKDRLVAHLESVARAKEKENR